MGRMAILLNPWAGKNQPRNLCPGAHSRLTVQSSATPCNTQ
jgi:hypothetical protein